MTPTMPAIQSTREGVDPTGAATAPRALVAVLVSAIVHVAIAAAIVSMGVTAARAIRSEAAPVMVAEWTPPPPAGVAPAPPELPVPGGAPVHAGPATRARVDDATAAAFAADRLARLAPGSAAPLRAPAPHLAGSLGFEGAIPAPWRNESFGTDRQRVAFIVDAGGRLLSALPAARTVLAQRLGALRPDQIFALFVARGNGIERAPGTPARATREAVAAALRWFTERAAPGGTADLGAALNLAWADTDPDAVCIVSRGASTVHRSAARSSGMTLAATADRLNPPDGPSARRRAAFLCVELGDAGGDGVLRSVGERHGGTQGYLLLDRATLGLGPGRTRNAAPAAPENPTLTSP